MLDLCLESISFLEKIKRKFILSSLPRKKVTPLPKKKLVTSEKVTTSEKVDKGTKKLYDTKEAVVKICSKDLDDFDGK